MWTYLGAAACLLVAFNLAIVLLLERATRSSDL
jgi:hypothetical protein